MRKFVRLCVAVVVLAVAGVVQQAQAGWKPQYADSPYRGWYEHQRDRRGWSCCARSDAHPVYDAYIKLGKWHVPIHGRDYEINPRQLLDGPNPTGHAVVWYDGVGDYVFIFCFAPGPMY
jgi:hypothetical protein